MKQHDSHIFFKHKIMTFNFDYCLEHCIHNYRFITIHSVEIKIFAIAKKSKSKTNIVEISIIAYLKMTIRNSNNVILM